MQSQLSSCVSSGLFALNLHAYANLYGASGLLAPTSVSQPQFQSVNVVTDDDNNSSSNTHKLQDATIGVVIAFIIIFAIVLVILYFRQNHAKPYTETTKPDMKRFLELQRASLASQAKNNNEIGIGARNTYSSNA